MEIPVELSRIIITETSPQQVIFLKEKAGQRSFPIVIGISEALAIDRRLKGVEMPRPMTHDLLARIIEAMGGTVEKIVINDLRDHTFIATLGIRRNGEMIEIDARPSDAIAIGVAMETPIFVAENVFNEVLNESMNLAGQRDNLQRRRDELVDQIERLGRYMEKEKKEFSDEEPLRDLQRQLREMRSELDAIEEILRHLP